MKPCDRYEEQISALLDGELHGEARRTLQQHLRTCPNCQETWRLYRDLSAALGETAVEPLDASMTGREGRIQPLHRP